MNWLTRFLRAVERRPPEPPAARPIWTGGRKPPASWDEWIVATTDRCGVVREAAVNALARAGHGPALPALLGRLNDWVPEVRRAALGAVTAFLDEDHASSWSSALAQVSTLARGGRADPTSRRATSAASRVASQATYSENFMRTLGGP